MTLIDGRGRLFGRVNLVDAGVVLLALLAVAGVVTAYRVFRLPGAPTIEAVEPATQAAVDGARVGVRGRDFLPFQRVFVRRSGDTPRLVHEDEVVSDAFTLVNHTQAQWAVESPTRADVRLPDRMTPGTYDLLFYDETRLLAAKTAAFTLTASAVPVTHALTSVVRVEGAFTRLTAGEPPLLIVRGRLASDRPDESIEILAVGPSQPDVVSVGGGTGAVPAALEGRVRVPATLRVRCTVVDLSCGLGGAALEPGRALRLRLGDRQLEFMVDELVSDLADAVADADVTVRFLVRPEEAAQMKAGDVDAAGMTAALAPRTRAVLASIASRGDVTRRALETVDKKPQWIEEPAVRIDAVLRVPVIRLDGMWFYKGQALKSGGTIAFETLTYKARAWVLNVAVRAPVNRRSSE